MPVGTLPGVGKVTVGTPQPWDSPAWRGLGLVVDWPVSPETLALQGRGEGMQFSPAALGQSCLVGRGTCAHLAALGTAQTFKQVCADSPWLSQQLTVEL